MLSSDGPGLKPAFVGPGFRGLKAPAPSVESKSTPQFGAMVVIGHGVRDNSCITGFEDSVSCEGAYDGWALYFPDLRSAEIGGTRISCKGGRRTCR
jgi:hypothetical protein